MILQKYRTSRIWNININIILASLSSIIISSWFVYATKYFTNDIFTITILSFLFDAIVDFGIFSILHLFVNLNVSRKAFGHDLINIQKQRLVLAVIYFFVSTGFQYELMSMGAERTIAFFWAYVIALGVTRTLHTIYGLKTGLFEDTEPEIKD